MGEKVVLPKFDLPGDRMHPAVKAVAVGGGVLCLLAVVGLGGALYYRYSLHQAAQKRQDDIVATRLAEAHAKAEESKARAAEAAARTAADKARAAEALAAKNAAKSAPKPGTEVADASAGAKAGGSSHKGHKGSSKGSGSSKTVATAKGPAAADEKKAPAKPGSKRDDAAIDKLLASFK